MTRLVWIGLTLIGLGLVKVLRAQGRPPSPAVGPRRVAALGDSITANLGRRGGYLDTVLARLPPGSAVQQFGYGGQGVEVISQHINEVLAWRPTDVVVLAGVNDLASRRPVERVTGRLSDMYRRFRAAGIRVVAVEVLPWGKRPTYNADGTARLNAWIRTAAREAGADSVVLTASMGDAQGWLQSAFTTDGIHLTPAGNRALGELIFAQAFA